MTITAPSAHELASRGEFTKASSHEVLTRVFARIARDSKQGSPRAPGVARRGTPDSKVAMPLAQRKRARPHQLMMECEGTFKPKLHSAVSSRARRCQVCLRAELPERVNASAYEPLLLNARGSPVKVPGNFCSKDCYEHV
jgi:hypothetical protein